MPITFTFIPAKPHLGGHHQFAFGTDDTWESAGSRATHDNASGDYLLQFNNGAQAGSNTERDYRL